MILPLPRGRTQTQFRRNYPAVISTLGMVAKGQLWLEGDIPAGGLERTAVDKSLSWNGTIVPASLVLEDYLRGKGQLHVTIRFIAEPKQLITLTNCSLELNGTGQIRFTAPSFRNEALGDDAFQAIETYFRYLQERVYKNIVVVFGAGASRDYFPTGNELLPELLSTCDELRELVERVFLANTDTPDKLRPTLSEVLGVIDIACEREEYLGRNFSVEKLRKIRTEVLDHLCQVFVDRSQNLKDDTNDYHILVANLLRMVSNGIMSQVDFISLNYDNLLERALEEVAGKKSIDYCIEIRDLGKPRESMQLTGGQQIASKEKIRVVKFHGSIDWMYCPNCHGLYHVETLRGLSRVQPKCPDDETKLKWFLYPPKREKHPAPEPDYGWMRLHSFADKLLREADKVIFVGYSLSEDDAYFRFRLKKHLHREDKPADIVVVDAPRGDKKGLTSTEKNYWHFFGPVDYRAVGFKSFVQELY